MSSVVDDGTASGSEEDLTSGKDHSAQALPRGGDTQSLEQPLQQDPATFVPPEMKDKLDQVEMGRICTTCAAYPHAMERSPVDYRPVCTRDIIVHNTEISSRPIGSCALCVKWGVPCFTLPEEYHDRAKYVFILAFIDPSADFWAASAKFAQDLIKVNDEWRDAFKTYDEAVMEVEKAEALEAQKQRDATEKWLEGLPDYSPDEEVLVQEGMGDISADGDGYANLDPALRGGSVNN